MTSKDQLPGNKFNSGLTDLGAQMTAPFYALSNIFLNAVNLQKDVVRFMNKESGSRDESALLSVDTSKFSPRVISILQQKAEAQELEDYITKLVEQDLDKKEEETITFREEVLSEINLLKQDIASRPATDANETVKDQVNDLRDNVTQLDEQKVGKEEIQTLLNTLRSEFLDQINLLKNELAHYSVVPVNSNKLNPVKEHTEKNDLKEGQLLESDQVTGAIKEVIDVDF